MLSWYLRKRMEQILIAVSNPVEVQQNLLRDLIKTAQRTEFGEQYGFKNFSTLKDFQEAVPIHSYEAIKPYIDKILHGQQNILWPTEIRWFAKSSGTTSAKSKFIPVSYEALEECHFRGGRDVLSLYCRNNPETKVFEGKGLLIGGSHEANKLAANTFHGDLSAVMMNNMPYWSSLLSTPKPEIALMSNWEEKLELIASTTINEDVRSISGVPTWALVVIKKLLEIKGTNNLLDIWPNLELFIHGGVSFSPYSETFEHIIPSGSMNYMETYNASEGFIAIQDDASRDDLLLMMDYGIFYEFIPLDELDNDHPKALTLDQVKLQIPYAMVITTNAGLWRYLIGDTICFTSLNPVRIKIVGRTKSYINAFGEELMVHNSDYAITTACLATNAKMKDYTAGPIYIDEHKKGGHEWFIEFEKEPDNLELFVTILDQKLQEANSDYEAKRAHDIALVAPLVHICPNNTFYKWLKQNNKLGGQHKVPRLNNNRKIIEEITLLIKNN
jgi:hypothetical protein